MNIFDKNIRQTNEAKVKFEGGEFKLLSPGEFVRCAVSGSPIALEDLKYWSVEFQEAYATAEISLQRYAQTRQKV